MPQSSLYLEKEVLIRLKNNDKEAFAVLYDRYQKPLRTFIMRYIKVPVYVEDILQEVFMKIWEIRERINPELAFKAYLYRITRNAVYKFLNKMAVNDDMIAQTVYHFKPDGPQPGLALEWKEFQQRVDEAIRMLPPRRQQVFNLCRVQQKSYDEVSCELGISRNTVKEHMVLAMKFIAEYLGLNARTAIPAIAFLTFSL